MRQRGKTPSFSAALQELFAAYDKDKSGSISFEELAEGLRGQGYVVNESEVSCILWFHMPLFIVLLLVLKATSFSAALRSCLLRMTRTRVAVSALKSWLKACEVRDALSLYLRCFSI